jgi:hypothetical protein
MISFAASILKELKHSPKKHEAELIFTTAKLLLSQVKLLLDKNMLEHNMFQPNFEVSPVNKTIKDAVEILRK